MGSHVRILRTQSGKAMPIHRPEIERALAGMGGKLAFLHGSEGEHIVMPALGDERERIVCEADELWARNPDERLLEAMIELARLLGARVRNDDFETLRSVDECYLHPDDRAAREAALASSGPGRAALRRARVIACLKLLLLALVAATALYRNFQGPG